MLFCVLLSLCFLVFANDRGAIVSAQAKPAGMEREMDGRTSVGGAVSVETNVRKALRRYAAML